MSRNFAQPDDQVKKVGDALALGGNVLMRLDPGRELLMSPEELLSHTRWVRAVAKALLRDATQVDDVVQATYLAALEKPPRPDVNLRSYLAGVTRNVVRQLLRTDRRRSTRERKTARPEGTPSAEELVERADLQRRVVQAVMNLNEPYRSALLLRYMEELTPNEIAERLSLPGSTVRSRIQRGLVQLRQELESSHGGSRRALSLSLIPLALAHRGADAAVTAGGAVTTGSGGLSMLASTKTILASAVLVTAGAVYFNLPTHTPPPATTTAGTDEARPAEPDDPAPVFVASSPPASPAPAPAAAPEAIEVEPAHVVSGRVINSKGLPVPGAPVFVGSAEDPFPDHPGKPHMVGARPGNLESKANRAIGRTFESGDDGTFRIVLPEKTEVYVIVLPRPGIRSTAEGFAPWRETPVTGLTLTAEVVPTATVHLSARDLSLGKRLETFRYRVRNGEGQFLMSGVVKDEVGTIVLEIPDGDRKEFQIVLADSSRGAARSTITLTPDEVLPVELTLQSASGIRGRVVDTAGEPVENALVYWGNQIRMRGDELFKPFDERRILDGTRTGDDGEFQLRGTGREITVYHASRAFATVARERSSEVVLPARGRIEGHLLDEAGHPLAHTSILIDRKPSTTTDAEGRFAIDDVMPGIRGLHATKRHFYSVEVRPGETSEVVIKPESFVPKVRVEFFAKGNPYLAPLGGAVIGTSYPSSLREIENHNGIGELSRTLPGRYLFLARGGIQARLDVDGSVVEADLGDADLTIRARPGARVYVVPHRANEYVRLLAGRMSITVPESGTVSVSPLPRGHYDIGIDRLGIFAEVEVDGPGAQVDVGED